MTATNTPPTSMRSLALTKYSSAAGYQLLELPVPALEAPDDVLVRVHAAGVNAGDCKLASGAFRFMMASSFPYKFAHDLSGTVAAVGEAAAATWAVGDEVFGMLPITRGGAASEYAVVAADRLCRKPASLSHTQAAALPQVAVTALQVLQRADAALPGGLRGKTVFVSGGLGGIGSAAIQLLRRAYGAGHIITTVSAAKVRRVPELLGPAAVDRVIDYTSQDVLACVDAGSVDFYLDTASTAFAHLALLKPHGALVSSVTSLCSGATMQRLAPTPWPVRVLLTAVFTVNSWRVRRWGAAFDAQLTTLQPGDLDAVACYAADGSLHAVIGRTAKLAQLDAVRVACTELELGKGVTGKFVIEMD